MQIEEFIRKIRAFYSLNRRSFPWRETNDPYAIFISEIMLQQTRTERVVPKFERFIAELPTFGACAGVSTEKLFVLWQGLGYNRRALAIRNSAAVIVRDFGGSLPRTREDLLSLPGVGQGTAGALLAFAFNTPTVFIETNIRRVFINEFFSGEQAVPDVKILPLIEETLDRIDPRNWYYALMDYGVMLAKTVGNPNRKSLHYIRQKPFHNSNRQIRGGILKLVGEQGPVPVNELGSRLPFPEERILYCLTELEKEGFVVCDDMVRFRS